jgi:glycerol-3-phosphate acyltransferase PlsY
MSVASLTGAVIVPVGVALTNGPRSLVFGVASGVSAFVFWTHRSNIGRLRRGEEPKLNFRKPGDKQGPGSIDGLSPQGRA